MISTPVNTSETRHVLMNCMEARLFYAEYTYVTYLFEYFYFICLCGMGWEIHFAAYHCNSVEQPIPFENRVANNIEQHIHVAAYCGKSVEEPILFENSVANNVNDNTYMLLRTIATPLTNQYFLSIASQNTLNKLYETLPTYDIR